MNKTSQWNTPESPDDFLDWLKQYHPKWVKDSDFNTLKNMLTTSDGLGAKIKTKALQKLIKLIKYGEDKMNTKILEEGDRCAKMDCDGIMGFEPVKNCSCHIDPPCSQCVENPLVCLKCGYSQEDQNE